MDTQKQSQRRGLDVQAEIHKMLREEQKDDVLASLASLYTPDACRAAEAATETIGRILSTGSIALEDVRVLADLEEILDDGVERLEAAREELAKLRARL